MKVEQHDLFGNIILPEIINLNNAPEFKQALTSLIEQGYKLIKVDCNKLKMIDSAGLGNLVLFQKKLKEKDGELKLVNVKNDYIQHLFDMIDLRRVINIE